MPLYMYGYIQAEPIRFGCSLQAGSFLWQEMGNTVEKNRDPRWAFGHSGWHFRIRSPKNGWNLKKKCRRQNHGKSLHKLF